MSELPAVVLKDHFTLSVGHPYPFVFLTVGGSHLFGFNSPDSDWDLRGAHIAPADAILRIGGSRLAEETVEREQPKSVPNLEEIVTQEIAKFMRLMLKNGGNLLEQVLSPHVVYTSSYHDRLRELAPQVVTKAHVEHYLGFARSQIKLMRRRPDKEVKIFLYIFRTLLSGIYTARGWGVEANIQRLMDALPFDLAFLDELIAIKRGTQEEGVLPASVSPESLWTRVDELEDVLRMSLRATRVPDEVPAAVVAEMNDVLLHIRRNHR